jgi:Peptidase propeptide and YPEB domain
VVSPRSIVQGLQQQGFSYISRPALAGQFYQVKARDPNGKKVKLYIDASSGRIVKVKS